MPSNTEHVESVPQGGGATPALTWRKADTRRALLPAFHYLKSESVMKIVNSLKSLKDRHRDNRVIRRRGRIYVINKTQKRFKARQG